MSRQTRLE